MPNNAHDTSSRDIFSSAHGSFSIPPETPEGRGHAASARSTGLFVASEPSSAPASAGRSRQPAFDEALGAVPRPASRGWQDKAAPETAPLASRVPAPGTNGERRHDADGEAPRAHSRTDGLKRSARMTLRVRPGVKTALERLATEGKVSLSTASATGLEVYARAKIHDQEEALFEPRMQAMMRREIRASDDRRVPFEIRTAIAAEHTRLIEADLYQRSLRREGVPLPEIKDKLKAMYRQARANILKKTPQLKTILQEWWQDVPDAHVSQEEREGGGEEGTR